MPTHDKSTLGDRSFSFDSSVWNSIPNDGTSQLHANPPVVGPWLFPGKSTQTGVTMMGVDDMVVGEDHVLGPSCQRYNWQTGR